jgi:hypothetical protein
LLLLLLVQLVILHQLHHQACWHALLGLALLLLLISLLFGWCG